MLARVKQTETLTKVTAFSGYEYTKRDWRPVPAGYEAEARRHERLDVTDIEPVGAKDQPSLDSLRYGMAETVDEAVSKRKKRRGKSEAGDA